MQCGCFSVGGSAHHALVDEQCRQNEQDAVRKVRPLHKGRPISGSERHDSGHGEGGRNIGEERERRTIEAIRRAHNSQIDSNFEKRMRAARACSRAPRVSSQRRSGARTHFSARVPTTSPTEVLVSRRMNGVYSASLWPLRIVIILIYIYIL